MRHAAVDVRGSNEDVGPVHLEIFATLLLSL